MLKSLSILLLGPLVSGFMVGVEESQAFQPLSQGISQHDQSVQIAQGVDCIRANRSEYLYGKYKVSWSYGGIFHESVLSMQGDSGTMLTRFYSSELGGPDVIEQDIQMRSCSFGLMLLGSSPRRPNGSKPTNYVPDNLILRVQPSGQLIILNCFQPASEDVECIPTKVTRL